MPPTNALRSIRWPPVLALAIFAGCGGNVVTSSGDGGSSHGECATTSLQAVTSVTDGADAVAGRWQICMGLGNLTSYWAPGDTAGMEFTPPTAGGGSCSVWGSPCVGGEIDFLVQGSSGLVRGQGSGYQIWYAIFGSGAELELALNLTPTNNSWSTSISASASPRELYVETTGYNSGVRMAAVP